MIDRRRLLTSAAAAGAAAALPRAAIAAGDEDRRLDAMLTRQLERRLDRSPEQVTALGLDKGARAGQRARLEDRSAAAVRAETELNRTDLAEIRTIRPDALSPAARLNYDIALFTAEVAAGYARFPWHTNDGWKQTPYAVSQIGGSYIDVPDFLDSVHPIETASDVEAFMSRLRAFGGVLDGETERLKTNGAQGAVAPDFILDKTGRQLRRTRDVPGADQALVRSLARRSKEKGLADRSAEAARLFDAEVRPALDRQIAAIEALKARSDHRAGVQRVPDGDAYYAQNLRRFTTTTYSPEEIHRIGLEQVADLQSRADALLKGQGYTQGTVAQRLAGLRKEPRFLFANDDAGREQLLAYVNEEMARVRARMPEVFARLPKTGFVVKRIPPATEEGAPGGYAQGGSLDGSRPGAYYINLRDTADWPRWTLKTLTYHEAAPGHLFEGALALESGELPLYRKLSGNSAYGEGWALYSERLADELGLYEGDPFGRIGYLESFIFRACRLVVDTGLHRYGWSREKAVQYFTENVGDPNESEVDRYCSSPGQACSYKIGETVISRLRDAAQKTPGFDVKRFHSVVLEGGRIPMTVLERRVRAAFPGAA